MKTLDIKYLLLLVVLLIFKVGLSQQINQTDTKFVVGNTDRGVITGGPIITPQTPHILPPNPVTPFNPNPPNPDPYPPPHHTPIPSSPGGSSPIGLPTSGTGARIKETSASSIEVAPELTAYPNPNNGKFTVEFHSSTSGNIIVRLSDITGKAIMDQKIEGFTGDYSNQFDLSDKAKGIYILSIEQNQKQVMKKIVVS